MKNSLVLDEGVIICAATGRNEQNIEDPSSIDLIRQILEDYHSLTWSFLLWERWKVRFNTVKQGQQALNQEVLRVITAILSYAETNVLIEEVVSVEGEELLPNDEVDRHMVRLAVNGDAILTTVDNRLIDRLDAASFIRSRGLVAVRPEAALPYARPW